MTTELKLKAAVRQPLGRLDPVTVRSVVDRILDQQRRSVPAAKFSSFI